MPTSREITDDVIKQINEALDAGRMTKGELAERMGVTPGYVSHLLVGRKRNLTVETLVKLANALDLSLEINFGVLRKGPEFEIESDILTGKTADGA